MTAMLEGKRALITGASRGIGRAIAAALDARGARVALIGRTTADLAETADQLSREPLICAGDITRRDDRMAARRAVRENWGGLDILINNAGIGAYKPFAEHSEEEIERFIAVNLTAPMLLTHELQDMLVEAHGIIVNIASDVGRRPIANMAPYVAAKHGMLGLSHALRQELRPHGVRVCLLLPGATDSNFNDSIEGDRPGDDHLRTRDVADAVIVQLSQPAHVAIDELTIHAIGQDA